MTRSTRQAKRRMGPEGSQVWHTILDGAEEILRDEGYAALTSRNIANRAELNQQLIYYYFHTMDDLIVALFRRAADREIDALNKAVRSAQPLREMWNACIHTQDNKIVSEFTALSNRNELLRREVIAFIKKVRRTQLKALKAAVENQTLPVIELPPEALVLIANGLGLALTRDCELGISEGHSQVTSAIGELLAIVESGDK